MIKHFVFVHTFTSSLHGLNRLSITFFEVGCDAYCCPSAIFRPASYGRVENRCAQLVISVLAPYFMLFSSVNENHEERIAYVTVIVYWKVQCIFFLCVCKKSFYWKRSAPIFYDILQSWAFMFCSLLTGGSLVWWEAFISLCSGCVHTLNCFKQLKNV